jgi:hypothetical protein
MESNIKPSNGLYTSGLLSLCVAVCLLCLLSVSNIEKMPGVPGQGQGEVPCPVGWNPEENVPGEHIHK